MDTKALLEHLNTLASNLAAFSRDEFTFDPNNAPQHILEQTQNSLERRVKALRKTIIQQLFTLCQQYFEQAYSSDKGMLFSQFFLFLDGNNTPETQNAAPIKKVPQEIRNIKEKASKYERKIEQLLPSLIRLNITKNNTTTVQPTASTVYSKLLSEDIRNQLSLSQRYQLISTLYYLNAWKKTYYLFGLDEKTQIDAILQLPESVYQDLMIGSTSEAFNEDKDPEAYDYSSIYKSIDSEIDTEKDSHRFLSIYKRIKSFSHEPKQHITLEKIEKEILEEYCRTIDNIITKTKDPAHPINRLQRYLIAIDQPIQKWLEYSRDLFQKSDSNAIRRESVQEMLNLESIPDFLPALSVKQCPHILWEKQYTYSELYHYINAASILYQTHPSLLAVKTNKYQPQAIIDAWQTLYRLHWNSLPTDSLLIHLYKIAKTINDDSSITQSLVKDIVHMMLLIKNQHSAAQLVFDKTFNLYRKKQTLDLAINALTKRLAADNIEIPEALTSLSKEILLEETDNVEYQLLLNLWDELRTFNTSSSRPLPEARKDSPYSFFLSRKASENQQPCLQNPNNLDSAKKKIQTLSSDKNSPDHIRQLARVLVLEYQVCSTPSFSVASKELLDNRLFLLLKAPHFLLRTSELNITEKTYYHELSQLIQRYKHCALYEKKPSGFTEEQEKLEDRRRYFEDELKTAIDACEQKYNEKKQGSSLSMATFFTIFYDPENKAAKINDTINSENNTLLSQKTIDSIKQSISDLKTYLPFLKEISDIPELKDLMQSIYAASNPPQHTYQQIITKIKSVLYLSHQNTLLNLPTDRQMTTLYGETNDARIALNTLFYETCSDQLLEKQITQDINNLNEILREAIFRLQDIAKQKEVLQKRNSATLADNQSFQLLQEKLRDMQMHIPSMTSERSCRLNFSSPNKFILNL